MSRNNRNKRYTKAQIQAKIEAKRKAKRLVMQKHITIFTLLALLIIGLVSTTFASFTSPAQTGDKGSLVAQITTNAVNQGNKDQIADTKANVDVAQTGYDISSNVKIYYLDTASWNACQMYIWKDSDGYNTSYTFTKIPNTKIYYYNFGGGWNGYSGFKFRSDENWSKQSSGDIKHSVSASSWYYGTSTTRKTTLSQMSGDAKVVTMVSTDGGATYVATASADVSTKVSGYSLTTAATSATSTSATTSTAGNYATINAAYGSTITYTANPGDHTFKGFSTTSSSTLPSMSSTSATYTRTASANSGNANTTIYAYYVLKKEYTYSVTKGYGGNVNPSSGSVEQGSGVEIKATPLDGYTFAEWTGLSKATIGSTTAATTTLTPTANGATVKANFRPDAPSKLTLTGSNVASGTSGDGSETNPFIVFEDGGFTLTANATVVSGATAHYLTSSSSDYDTKNTFTPDLTTKGTDQTYTVYAKADVSGYSSTDPISATAHYLVFSHLNGANTGFKISDDQITDVESVTFSGAYVNGVAEAEKTYIKQTYQVSTNNSTFSDITGSTWSPSAVGTYYFRLKTTNQETGETVYSTSQKLTVIQSTVYYDIKVVNDGTTAATVTLKTDGTTITDEQILSNSPLKVSITRPNSNYYIEYLKVDTLTEQDNMNVNGNITDYLAYDHVKGNVEIHYKLALKPTVKVSVPTNAESISFKYYSDGVLKTVSAAGTYSVDHNSNISYTVTPKTGFYVSTMTGVTMGTHSAGAVTGTENNVTANISDVTATLTANRTVSVSIDKTNSDVTSGASMTIDGTALGFGQPKPLNYGAESTIVITPPEGCYAVVSGNDVEAEISTDGKATFKVKLTGQNKNYTVKFVNNPKIYMVQPKYGSIYITDGSGNYYFNGDSVGYGTVLTVNVKKDHANAILNDVIVNVNNTDNLIGETDGSKFRIYDDSTASANITIKNGHEFIDSTEYGMRRIFFTDNLSWGDNNVSVHYSDTSGDTDFSKNSVVMTFKFLNDASRRVYYADIPYSAKYVTFYNKSNTSQKTSQATITNEGNAFWNDNGTCQSWQENYSDYIATDRETTIQQGVTVKNEPVTFMYSCDFGDGALSAKVVAGNAATFDFDKGVFSVTPTENTHAYTLVEVKSSASTTVKYYLIRVENFEIYNFTGLQKIYNSAVFNNIQFDLIVKGGVLNYAAQYFVSDTNTTESYALLKGTSSGFEYVQSLEGYINSFLIEYQINSLSGVKYYKVEAQDGANHKASATAKTLFGTKSHSGERVIYFYNSTNVNISKYNVRACFMDADGNNKTFVTMQRVGDTDYYRAVIPDNADIKVNFYLCNKNTFSDNYSDFDGKDDITEFYSFGVFDVPVPKVLDDENLTEYEDIVYKVNDINDKNGIVGDFAEFDY